MKPAAALAALLIVLAACSHSPAIRDPKERAHVERVVDGDTIIVVVGGERIRVRLIGVDTPETVKPQTPVQCFGPEASHWMKELLTDRDVDLAYDVRRLDRFGRTLAYVYTTDGTFVNLELVRRGFGSVLSIRPDVAYGAEFSSAEATARTARAGLWGACPARQ